MASACGGGEAGTIKGPQVHDFTDGTKALIAGRSEGGSDVRLSGTLTKGTGGCVGVDVGGRVVVVAFGSGSVVDGSEFRVRIHDKERELGDRVTLDGGAAEPPYSSRIPEPPAACVAENPELFVANES